METNTIAIILTAAGTFIATVFGKDGWDYMKSINRNKTDVDLEKIKMEKEERLKLEHKLNMMSLCETRLSELETKMDLNRVKRENQSRTTVLMTDLLKRLVQGEQELIIIKKIEEINKIQEIKTVENGSN